MDSKSPYLESIQRIPGCTAKQKYESLNSIIKQIIESRKAPGDFASATLYGSTIPQVLTPLIEIEIAKIVIDSCQVVAALKSDDAIIVNRALQADWFFDGSIKEVTNPHFFVTQILPEVSLNTRTKIMKRLSQHLGHKKEYAIAQEFFQEFRKLYDMKEVMYLLSACSEEFISAFIKGGTVRLPRKIVIRLFSKYPELMIEYLKYAKPKVHKVRVIESISISDYLDILPKLIKKHVDDFIDIVDSFPYKLNIKKLSDASGKLFLKGKGTEVLVKSPEKYFEMLSLQLITRKLSKEQFELMLQKLFPKDLEQFHFDDMLKYVKFQPEDMKLPLIANTFKHLYGTDLIDSLDKVTPKMLLMLTYEDRIKVAQKKLRLKFYLDDDYEESWICYLSTADSIPRIKDEISKTKEMNDRRILVAQLIYTCKANNSKKDLLHVLQYISSRHCNEAAIFWLRTYEVLMKHFDLAFLSADHWTVLSEMIQRSHVKDHLQGRQNTSEKLLEEAVHFNLINSIPIEDRMIMLTELKIRNWNSSFNILQDYPSYEKLCLETFIDIIPRKFPEDNPIWKDERLDTILYLVKALYDYNRRIIEAAEKTWKNVRKEELLSFINYSWLFEVVKDIVLNPDTLVYQYKVDELKKLLCNHERELYDSWFPPEEKMACVSNQEGLKLLKKEPGRILEKWKDYYQSCDMKIYDSGTKKFLKKCIWYSEIPIKFLEESLSRLSEGGRSTIMILAILLHGPEFTRVIEPMVPSSKKLEIDGEEAKKTYQVIRSIPKAINHVNPPPPLELIGKFCQGDYLRLVLGTLMNVSRRLSVDKLIIFAKKLMKNPVSVKKQGIKLMYAVFPREDLCDFFIHSWNSEKHISIREIIFKKSYNLFTDWPCKDSWILIKYLIEGLTLEDTDCFEQLRELSNVSNEFVQQYFETVFNKIEALRILGLDKEVVDLIVNSLLLKVDPPLSTCFSEDYCRFLLRNFAFNLDMDSETLLISRSYAVNTFLFGAGDKLESRLSYFCDLFFTAVKEHWDQLDSKNAFYPMRQLSNNIIDDIVNADSRIGVDPKIPKAVMQLFSSELQPIQDPDSYMSLLFTIEFKKVESNGREFGLSIGKQLPEILNIFSPEMIIDVANNLSKFIEMQSHDKSLIEHITEALTEVELIHSTILASIMLHRNSNKIPSDMRNNIVQKLRKVNHPVVLSFLNKYLVSLPIF